LDASLRLDVCDRDVRKSGRVIERWRNDWTLRRSDVSLKSGLPSQIQRQVCPCLRLRRREEKRDVNGVGHAGHGRDDRARNKKFLRTRHFFGSLPSTASARHVEAIPEYSPRSVFKILGELPVSPTGRSQDSLSFLANRGTPSVPSASPALPAPETSSYSPRMALAVARTHESFSPLNANPTTITGAMSIHRAAKIGCRHNSSRSGKTANRSLVAGRFLCPPGYGGFPNLQPILPRFSRELNTEFTDPQSALTRCRLMVCTLFGSTDSKSEPRENLHSLGISPT